MFSSTARLVGSIVTLTLATSVCAQAAQGERLATVAAENGFTYQWIASEAGAMLARPGVRIVIRAGRIFYEVNDATPIADAAPRFDGRDLVISQKLAAHLRALAMKYPYPAAEDVSAVNPGAPAMDQPAATDTGTLTLSATQIPGREAIALRGMGPANTQITLTLTGLLSTDLPVVVLSRKTIATTTDGSFFAEVYVGQNPHSRTVVVATVTTPSGAATAEARVIIGVPSPQIKSSGLDDWPKK